MCRVQSLNDYFKKVIEYIFEYLEFKIIFQYVFEYSALVIVYQLYISKKVFAYSNILKKVFKYSKSRRKMYDEQKLDGYRDSYFFLKKKLYLNFTFNLVFFSNKVEFIPLF
jgi:hypothetical protein